MDSILNKIHELLLEKGVEELERKAFIQQLQKELKGKKYGLVWENKVEKVSEKLKTHIPYLTEVEEKRLSGSPDDEIHHLLIEGDNLEALTLLQTTHKGEVNICYIDPPYNRGKDDFVYNDDYIDEEDVYRHSKWLSFMEKRLRLAYDLLADDGVIFISIDDNEFAQLKLLCDEIFREQNFIGCLPRITKKNGKSTNTIAKNHDYLLIYSKNENIIFNGIKHFDKGFKYEDEFVDKRGKYKLNQTLDYDSLQYSKSMDFEILIDGESFIPGGDKEKQQERFNGNHGNTDWVWRWSKEKFDFGLANGFVVIKRTSKGRPRIYTKTYLNATIEEDENGYYVEYLEREKKATSLSFTDNQYSNDKAKKIMKNIFGKSSFDYVKPTELISMILTLHPNPNAVVLDFFAGSGTTGQAVLELNKEDGGKRKCILCTNNEVSKDKQKKYFSLNATELKTYSKTEEYKTRIKEPEFQSLGICQAVTYKRIQSVVTGYKATNKNEVKGIPTNWHYYKINTIPKVNNSTDNAIEYLTKGIEIISIKENAFNRDNFKDYSILSNKDKVILVYLEPFVLGHDVVEISKKLEGYPQSQKIIYSTMTDVSIEGIEVKGYPQEILEQIERIQQILKRWEDESGEE